MNELFVVVAFFAREFAHFWNTDCNHRQQRIKTQSIQVLPGERFTHIGHLRQAHVGLVDSVLANRVVILHARKRRLQLNAGFAESGNQKCLDHFEDAILRRK